MTHWCLVPKAASFVNKHFIFAGLRFGFGIGDNASGLVAARLFPYWIWPSTFTEFPAPSFPKENAEGLYCQTKAFSLCQRTGMEVTAEVQIQAARSTVWRKFIDISTWPQWHLQISRAEWHSGPPWKEDSIFLLSMSPFLVPLTIRSQIKMVSPQNLVVWESRVVGLTAVHVFEFSDSLGGCLVREKETYHGPWVGIMSLLQVRQSNSFRRSLHKLKALAEVNRAWEA